MKILISGGTILDPGDGPNDGYEGPGDLLIENGRIVEIVKPGTGPKDVETYDASDLFVAPGLVDIHTHLREPGYEYKETIATGTRAAAAGGVTSVVCMANTNPVNDNEKVTNYIKDKAKKEGVVNVYPVGAVTNKLEGKILSKIDKLKEAGIVALSDDGNVVSNSSLMRRGMESAKSLGLPVITHSEDMSLVGEGVMNEGAVSSELGLPANSSASEEIMIFRDVTLARLTGVRLHVAHVSTAGGVRIIRDAKGRGVSVTCETCPHYFSLTDEAVRGLDTNCKVNPPLRSKEDKEAVIEGLIDGTIDIIASDHAPHSIEDKSVEEFKDAPSGIVGLETIFSLSLRFVHEGKLTLIDLIRKLTKKPADIVGIPAGAFSRGASADIMVFDPNEEWVVSPDAFFSKGKNTPFSGWRLKGRSKLTFVGGRPIYKEGEIV
jgi:dihydroorotase